MSEARGIGRAARVKTILVAALAAIAVAVLGALSTDLSPWYYSLREPPWKPPDVLFGPAWTLIYACATLAGLRAWWHAPRPGDRAGIVVLFACNAFFNVLWSVLFFRLRRPDWALAEVGLLWLSILVLIVVLRRYSKASGWLLVPYLAWVSFAAALNAAVVRLNGPFGAA